MYDSLYNHKVASNMLPSVWRLALFLAHVAYKMKVIFLAHVAYKMKVIFLAHVAYKMKVKAPIHGATMLHVTWGNKFQTTS